MTRPLGAPDGAPLARADCEGDGLAQAMAPEAPAVPLDEPCEHPVHPHIRIADRGDDPDSAPLCRDFLAGWDQFGKSR